MSASPKSLGTAVAGKKRIHIIPTAANTAASKRLGKAIPGCRIPAALSGLLSVPLSASLSSPPSVSWPGTSVGPAGLALVAVTAARFQDEVKGGCGRSDLLFEPSSFSSLPSLSSFSSLSPSETPVPDGATEAMVLATVLSVGQRAKLRDR